MEQSATDLRCIDDAIDTWQVFQEHGQQAEMDAKKYEIQKLILAKLKPILSKSETFKHAFEQFLDGREKAVENAFFEALPTLSKIQAEWDSEWGKQKASGTFNKLEILSQIIYFRVGKLMRVESRTGRCAPNYKKYSTQEDEDRWIRCYNWMEVAKWFGKVEFLIHNDVYLFENLQRAIDRKYIRPLLPQLLNLVKQAPLKTRVAWDKTPLSLT